MNKIYIKINHMQNERVKNTRYGKNVCYNIFQNCFHSESIND